MKGKFVNKSSKKTRRLDVYANMTHKVKSKRDAKAREKARYLATLPKDPVKRFFYRMHPKRVVAYWFSRKGAMMALKIVGVSALVLALFIGGLFAYFRKDLDAIRPGEIAKRVQTTVTSYYDRNGQLLWEDKGDGNYKLVVESNEISDLVKKATIAIEDKDFYSHNGVSVTGLIRAVVNNASGGSTQGGSTLTQQLVKQVFFADQAQDRGLSGIPRKIKELILSVEIERMYNKEQILALYLNESPYGGRRNGVESAAQTYFGKSAKDLKLSEAALLAAIPQNPTRFNPYNTVGNEQLIARQHTVLDNMVELGMVSREDANSAKDEPIIDTLIPEAAQFSDIKAPHFVQMVRSQLEEELGKATVGRGGLSITTTLDLRVQNKLEEAMDTMFKSSSPTRAGFTNGSATVEDTQTGQIIALLGSRSFTYPGFGQDNASTAYIQPGSTVKPFVYAKLFEKKSSGQANYGSGSVLKDENIDSLYGAKVQNFDAKFWGDINIRTALANSRNIPAIKAMYINGVKPTLDLIHDAGGSSYCTQGTETQTGLASAIGGCGIKQTDLTNAYSTLSRMGVYKPQSSVLEVKNNAGETLKKWSDSEEKRIMDAQQAYIVADILRDDVARSRALGARVKGMYIPGVPTATKTGTSDLGTNPKDFWMASYSPVLAMTVWLGNSDATVLKGGSSLMGGPIVDTVMAYAHKEIYANEGKWKLDQWFSAPNGIQRVGNEMYPAWWQKGQGESKDKLVFDKLSKYKATDCTPANARIELDVTKYQDPITKKDVFIAPDGYDASKEDDKHACSDTGPAIGTISVTPQSGSTYKISVPVNQGTFALTGLTMSVGGQGLDPKTISANGTYDFIYTSTSAGSKVISVTATDAGYYTDTDTKTQPFL